MGRGLSKLQIEILAVLVHYRTSEEVEAATPDAYGHIFIGDLPRPSTILDTLGRPRTSANFVVVSKALKRLLDRDLVTAQCGWLRTQGSGYRYAAAWLQRRILKEGGHEGAGACLPGSALGARDAARDMGLSKGCLNALAPVGRAAMKNCHSKEKGVHDTLLLGYQDACQRIFS